MPTLYLSPSTQEYNKYVTGGSEEEYMNLIADRMEPYLRSSGITFVRNDPDRTAAAAISESNSGNYDVHLALHSNAAPPNLSGKLRGIDIYYYPGSPSSERLATIIANNLKMIYPLPDKSRAVPTDFLGEVTRTRATAVLAELGYHDNVEDEAWIKANLSAIARNLVLSLTDYFDIPFIEATAARKGTVILNEGNLNLRRYPSMEGTIIGSIPNGSTVDILGSSGNWYVVRYNGQTGYASSDYIFE
ncbi:MAG: SH3 domain-containing protein [Oscillospiraceae bacterium]|nr:SH3 domain-containing protein [Oscillospiraceae bacterium]